MVKDCLQKGVLSPLLQSLIVYKLSWRLNDDFLLYDTAVLIDEKFSWTALNKVTKKAHRTFWAYRVIFRKTKKLRPNLQHWVYTMVARRIIICTTQKLARMWLEPASSISAGVAKKALRGWMKRAHKKHGSP
jgi:hypothetical protein